jgi:hypothetical protein
MSICYVGCLPVNPHIVPVVPHVPIIAHLAFTGGVIVPDILAAGVCLVVGGVLIATEERLRRGTSRH